MSCLTLATLALITLAVITSGAKLNKSDSLVPSINSGSKPSKSFSPNTLKHLVRRKRTITGIKLCGDNLVYMLQMVCRGGLRRKRDLQDRTFLITNRDHISNFASNWGIGLSESCCRHACSLADLHSACQYLDN